MFRLPTVLVLLIVSFGADSADAQGRLVSQQVRGAQRYCAYENSGPDRVYSNSGPNRTRNQFRQLEVGAGEPCPFRYRAPSQPQTPSIPPLATLVRTIPSSVVARNATLNGQRSAIGQKACVYAYLGLEYVRLIDQSLQCPLTPHFLPR